MRKPLARLPTKDGSRRSQMTGNDTCALAVAIVLNRLMREIWSKRQIEGQFHHRMSTCAVPALPLCTNRQSIQLAANLPTSHRVRKTTGAIHNTGATSTPGGYVREKPKTIQQQVKSERSARGYSTVKYGQINSSQTVSSPFTKPTNTITVSQLSSPTTTTLKTQYSSVLLQKKLFIIAGFFKLPRAHPWLAAVSSSC